MRDEFVLRFETPTEAQEVHWKVTGSAYRLNK